MNIPMTAAILSMALLLAGCIGHFKTTSAKLVTSTTTFDSQGNRVVASLWQFPDGDKVTIVDTYPPGSNEQRRTEPPPRIEITD